ncbi:response regulator [Vibrio sp. SCSIO 43136]|uniref:response regulator n=1 Tax=Vibrio sp. SCSIO 43136 TaxID=2819101 RepID=UPI002075C887|nr:response regulator [Vibrio sp. SCSIO 43136]USD66591.1 response regulator [Vibrio sp. SCSIO 43136]
MKVLICDDSALARKSLARSITQWEGLHILLAEDGREALSILSEQNIDVMFLDLNMPVMDGYEVLSVLPVSNYHTKVVVVSGDIQQEAKRRCLSMGAHAFIEKPFKQQVAAPLLASLGLKFHQTSGSNSQEVAIDPLVKFKELSNIAIGRGAALMSDHFGHFIHLPVPHLGLINSGEVAMMVDDVLHREGAVAVAQRFVGGGIHGEALVCMRGDDITEMGAKLAFVSEDSTYNETVLNLASILISSYLVSLGDQLDSPFSLRQPSIIDRIRSDFSTLGQTSYDEIFTVEYTYIAENSDFECEVLFFIDPQSIGAVKKIVGSF